MVTLHRIPGLVILASALFLLGMLHPVRANAVSPLSQMPSRAAPNPEHPSSVPVETLAITESPTQINLGPPTLLEVMRPKSGVADNAIGFGRSVPMNMSESHSANQMYFRVSSDGAEQLRVSIVLDQGHYDIYAWGDGQPTAVVDHRDIVADSTSLWTPLTDGSVQNILVVSTDVTQTNWSVSVARVSHLDRAIGKPDNYSFTKTIGVSASCQLDAVCLLPLLAGHAVQTFPIAANSVALLITTNTQGNSSFCSGTLLNSPTYPTPFVLTANHCIEDEPSLTTLWFNARDVCGIGPAQQTVQVAGGAIVLWQSSSLDGALIRLNQAPPAGSGFSGWDTSKVPFGQAIVALHHPMADVLKASFGEVEIVDSPAETVSGVTYAPGTFYIVDWEAGFSEPGSSGSALFTYSPEGNYMVRGTLNGGPPSSCSSTNNRTYYSQLYNQSPFISPILLATAPPPPPPPPPQTTGRVSVVEYYNATLHHYFITPNTVEIGLLGKPPFDAWQPTGLSFLAYPPTSAPSGSVGVCRFFNDHFPGVSTHFYAPHGLGCEQVLASFPDWTLEDAQLFYARLPDGNGTCPAGQIPVYRLYNNGMGGAPNHRFTISASVRQQMIANGYSPEGAGIGVGWCAPQ